MTLLQDIGKPHRGTAAPRKGNGAQRTRSRAAQRAIDRHRRRTDRDAGRAGAGTDARPVKAGKGSAGKGRPSSLRDRVTRIPFVVPVLALLVVGLGVSLLLSTKAAADSYRLGIARQQNQSLLDKRDSLKRTYESGDSAPELSDKAAKLGMIPAKNPPRMIVGDDGRPRIVGHLEPARGRAMQSLNPPTGPDPVATIDPKKVDDSRGLPGGGGANPAGAQPTTPTSANPAPPAPAPTAPGATQVTPPAPGAAPAAGGPAAAPNVLPSTPNAPGANSPASR